MSKNDTFNRRALLRNAPLTAFVGRSLAKAAGDERGTSGKFDFDTPYNRVGTDCVKWDQQIRTYGKENIAVGMGIADMDFRAAPCITQALAKRVQHENWGYLDMPHAFSEAIIRWNKRCFGIDIHPDSLMLSTGVHPALISALLTFSPPGSKVLMMTPIYSGFFGDLAFCGVSAEECPLKLVNGRYSIDFEDFERRISHDTKTLIFCNPHNPTGNCWSREDMMRVGEICTKRGVVVLVDEIHCDLVTRGNKYTPYCTLDNRDIVRNSITFKAASKSFSLSAMKCGWFFSKNADYLARIKANHKPDINTLGVVANLAALTEGEEWLNQVVAYLDTNHDFVASFVREKMNPLVKTVKPQGTYLSWLDVSELSEKIGATAQAAEVNKNQGTSMKPVTAETIVERWFVKNAKVHLNAGSSFGHAGTGHMRMNIATSRKTLELALTNIANTLKHV
jgi:cystathionine beta-lyase